MKKIPPIFNKMGPEVEIIKKFKNFGGEIHHPGEIAYVYLADNKTDLFGFREENETAIIFQKDLFDSIKTGKTPCFEIIPDTYFKMTNTNKED